MKAVESRLVAMQVKAKQGATEHSRLGFFMNFLVVILQSRLVARQVKQGATEMSRLEYYNETAGESEIPGPLC